MENFVKSCDKSNALRVDGNEFYKQRKFFDALLKYNESLCFAEKGSVNAGHAFANRSAIYLEMRLYEECLQNIQLAFTHNYPQKNFEVLKKREEKCREMMRKCERKNSRSDEIFKLSHPQHKNLPSIVDCLELKFNKKFGRHIITNRSLSVGDVIAIDEPFCKILRKDFLLQRCSNCFKSNNLSLLPCLGCTEVMFCSYLCRDEANAKFHQHECPVMNLISALSDNMQVALRSFFIVLSTFGDLKKFMKFMDEHKSKPTTVLENPTKKFESIISLCGNEKFLIDDQIFELIFKSNEKLMKIWKFNENFIKEFLLSHIQIATRNFHEICEWSLKKKSSSENNEKMAYQTGAVGIGTGSFAFAALLNHSCAPNVCRSFINGKLAIIVQQPIEAGDQIFDNYGYIFTRNNAEYRKFQLADQYCFSCQCEACLNNFPLLPTLKIIDKACFKLAKKFTQEIVNLNSKKAKFKIKEIAENIQKFHLNFPSMELCSMMESFIACIEIYQKPEIQFV